jgi:uncharacterized ubiquitin-like protein YukD
VFDKIAFALFIRPLHNGLFLVLAANLHCTITVKLKRYNFQLHDLELEHEDTDCQLSIKLKIALLPSAPTKNARKIISHMILLALEVV